jgi:glycosyltransferase involved in cell wall biosynthesis
MREAIQHGETGYLVTSRDWREMAEYLSYLIDHPEQRSAIGQRASTFVLSTFTRERQYSGFRELLECN